jgi:adenylylsulfate kinase
VASQVQERQQLRRTLREKQLLITLPLKSLMVTNTGNSFVKISASPKKRLGFVASRLSEHGIVCIISAINPYDEIRHELVATYEQVKTVYIDCPVNELITRDTKGLYKRALLPDGHPDKVSNLTGINDPFEAPANPDLHLRTNEKTITACTNELFSFIRNTISSELLPVHAQIRN